MGPQMTERLWKKILRRELIPNKALKAVVIAENAYLIAYVNCQMWICLLFVTI
jgi:hypothetical protein